MKNMKRIHSVTLKRMIDESPDTSWLGEYAQRAESEYSIDREHGLDCPQQTFNSKSSDRCMMVIAYVDKLERAIAYLNESGPELVGEAFDDALTILGDTQEAIQEEANACTCGGQHLDRNSYQFFNPNHENYKGLPEDEIRKYCLQDYARMESLNNGDFCFIGIRAEADYSTGGQVSPVQTVSSGGLWGIESDSSPEYLAEIEAEELLSLKSELKAIGFSSRAIATAFKNVERKES
jgi:hypothetical protein